MPEVELDAWEMPKEAICFETSRGSIFPGLSIGKLNGGTGGLEGNDDIIPCRCQFLKCTECLQAAVQNPMKDQRESTSKYKYKKIKR